MKASLITRVVYTAFAALIFWFTEPLAAVQTQVIREQRLSIRTAAVRRIESTQNLNLVMVLPFRNQNDLSNLLHDIYNSAGTNFHHYVTSKEFTKRFGPSEQNYQTVMEFAKVNHLKVTGTYTNHTLLDVCGTVTDIEKAFHVHLNIYRHPTEARNFYAPDTEPSVDLAVPLLEVKGLDNYELPKPLFHRRSASARTADLQPNDGTGPNGLFWGNDFRKAYLPGVTLNGAGQKVGLFEVGGYYSHDPVQYAIASGLTNAPAITNVLIDGFDGSVGPDEGETSLDIEMVLAMAPAAEVMVYEGSPTNNTLVIDMLNQMANDDAAKQLSSSWSFETGPGMEQIFQQMAAQGQSFCNSSGDHGAYSGPVTMPSDDPYITIVGGTTLTTDANGAWAGEAAWNWATNGNGEFASGGGISTRWPIPTWQQSTSMAANHGSTKMRNLPDVAMHGDFVSVVAGGGQQEEIGGTSVSAPLWAGFMALVNQKAAMEGKQSVGFVNPALYTIANSSNYNLSFNDIVSGNNTNDASPTNFPAVTGYDLCTGWGSPKAGLIDALLNVQFSPTPGWTLTTLPALQWYRAACSGDGNQMLVGDRQGFHPVYVSLTGGATWRSAGPVGGWFALAISDDGTKMAAGANLGPIYLSTDAGVTWSPSSAPSNNTWCSLSFSADGTKLAAGTRIDNVIEVSTNGGGTWQVANIPAPPNGLVTVAWSANGNVLVSTALPNEVSVSTNDGNSCSTATISNENLVACAASADGSRLYASGNSFWVSTNYGAGWTQLTSSPGGYISVACSADGQTIYGIAPGGLSDVIYLSRDGGLHWTNITPTSAGWSSLACSSDGSKVIAAANGQFVYTGFFPFGPTILAQTTNQFVQCGTDASFSVRASGSSPLTYQWYFGNAPLLDKPGISGTASPNLRLTALALSQSGVYSVVISNPYGSTNSQSVSLTVTDTNPPTLGGLAIQPDGTISGSLMGFAGPTSIETSTDLVAWQTLTNLLLINSPVSFVDTLGTNSMRRFYRAKVR